MVEPFTVFGVQLQKNGRKAMMLWCTWRREVEATPQEEDHLHQGSVSTDCASVSLGASGSSSGLGSRWLRNLSPSPWQVAGQDGQGCPTLEREVALKIMAEVEQMMMRGRR